MKQNLPKPSHAETEILNILWDDPPYSVKDVHEKLRAKKDVGYTTTLKQMQRLLEKGLVTREPGEGKSFLYSAAVSEQETKQHLFNRFVETTFGNSVSDLVMHALGNTSATEDELAKIKKLIHALERK